jgi:hypothetical protein
MTECTEPLGVLRRDVLEPSADVRVDLSEAIAEPPAKQVVGSKLKSPCAESLGLWFRQAPSVHDLLDE